MGPGRAAQLLAAGCNDMGGSIMNETITRAAGEQAALREVLDDWGWAAGDGGAAGLTRGTADDPAACWDIGLVGGYRIWRWGALGSAGSCGFPSSAHAS